MKPYSIKSFWFAAASACVLLAAMMALVTPAVAKPEPTAGRVERLLTDGWRFTFNNELSETTAQQADLNDSQWQRISLPHTWNRVGGMTGKTAAAMTNDTRGKGWYRLRFDGGVAATPGLRNWLQFKGAGTVTDVWLNGVALGRHSGAFGAFRFDVTDALKPGSNLLVVRTDNSDPATPGAVTAETIPISGSTPRAGA